jgi:hypothetical protein
MATNDWDNPNTPLVNDINEPSTLDEWNRLNTEAMYRAKQRVQPVSSLLSKAQEGTAAGTDVARTLLGGPAAAIGGAWQALLSGEPSSVEQNQYDLYKRLAQPSTRQGQAFEENVAGALEASKLPPVFPEAAGLAGRGFTPNDARVIAAEAKNFGKQVREIPTDFTNAQSGLTRIDPLTGKPTIGTKLQGVAEGVGDIIAQREAAGKSAIPALLDAKMNIVRPEGTRILRAKQPEGGADIKINSNRSGQVDTLDPLLGELNDFTMIDRSAPVSMVVEDYLRTYMDLTNRNNRLHDQNWNKTALKQARELFPDAPDDQTALSAMTTRYGGAHTNEMDQQKLRALDEYAKSPEAAEAVAQGATPIPSVDDFYKMHEASNKWRNNNLGNFISKYSGTASDPALKLAEQGLTFSDPSELLRLQPEYEYRARINRELAQMPEDGIIAPKLEAKQYELDQAVQYQNEIGNEGDPNAQRAAGDKVAKLRKEVDNLKIGAAYENAVDASVRPANAQSLAEDLNYENRQYFPSLTGEKDPNALAYRLKSGFVERLGFDQIAAQMHKDILSGKIALDKVPNISVDAYIKKNAEARKAAQEVEENQKLLYTSTVKKRFSDMAQNLPPDAMKFGNAFVLESTSDTPQAEVMQRASDDTGCLDHCVGQGGSASQRGYTVHPFTGREKSTYEPIMRLDLPGVPNPKASDRAQTETTSYIRGVLNGNKQLGHIRDASTGMPAATIEFIKLGPNKYDVGYVSGPAEVGGATNGPIDEKYHNAIRDYLNSRADQINETSSPLSRNTSIYDTADQGYSGGAVEAGYRDNHDLRAAYPDLPRFITKEDAQAIREGTYQMPEPSPSRAVAPALPAVEQQELVNNLGDYLEHMYGEIEQNAGDNAQHGREIADTVRNMVNRAYHNVSFHHGTGQFLQELGNAFAQTNDYSVGMALESIISGIEEHHHNVGGLAPPAVAPGMAGRDLFPAPRGVPEHDQELTFTDPHSIASHLVMIDRDADGMLNRNSINSTSFALEHGQLDYPGYTNIPPGAERAAAMRPIYEAYIRATNQALAAEQAMHAARGNLQTANYEHLAEQLTEGQRGYNQQVATQIARQARTHGVPVEEVMDMIRNGARTYGGYSVDLSAFSPGQLEVLARDAHRMMTFNQGHAEGGAIRHYAKGGAVSAPSKAVQDILYNNPPPAPMGENPYADVKTVQQYQSMDQPSPYFRGLTMNQYYSLAPEDRAAVDAQAKIDHPIASGVGDFIKMGLIPGSMAFRALSDLYQKYFPGPPAVPEAAYTGDYSTLTPEQKTQYENVIAGQPSIYDKGLMSVNTSPQTTATVWTGRDGLPIMSGGVPVMTGYGAYLGPQQELGRTIESAFSEGESPGDTQSFAEASAARDAADAAQQRAEQTSQDSRTDSDSHPGEGGAGASMKKGGAVRRKPTTEQMRFELMMRK